MNIAVVGHVDHGKSTIVGRLLADTGTLPDGKLEQVRATCARNAKPFEYAFLIDALKEEQGQGITIDSARVFFKTPRRPYIIIDAPGHLEFLKNMITGAARAEAALLVVDAREGVQENTRRHGRLLPLLGVRHVAVLVNKIDLVDYSRAAFCALEHELREFLGGYGVTIEACIPVSGREGTNLAARAPETPWYAGPTVVEFLDALEEEPAPVEKPFRMPVQGVYKFTAQGDDRRIVAGGVASGRLRVGDEVLFYPSGKRSRVKTLEGFNVDPRAEAGAGEAAGFTLTDQIYVQRGEVACRADEERPSVAARIRVSLFWLGTQPLVRGRQYRLKLGTASVGMELEAVEQLVDASELGERDTADAVQRHEVAECVLRLERPLAVDAEIGIAATGRFVIVDEWEIRGGGIVREALPDPQAAVRERVLVRNAKWEPSGIPFERRVERYAQLPAMVLITGPRDADRKSLARALEARLFEEGRLVYFLGIGNLLYGVDADLERTGVHRHEHLRRLGEVANLMLDAGMLLVVTAAELTPDELDLVGTAVEPGRIHTVWLGGRGPNDLASDLVVDDSDLGGEQVERICRLLEERGVVGR
ncbi:protein synthesis factor GTP-binding protein (plasmid) [Gemmatirosa kalamazoonensis]|uniref:Protein synthesis factor GTP-binding protein n=1 Tax=Gemmatirosa kalamazoonensis TaxID=861299 RepID=W0RTC9_9BACT|nr:GTP-binding protein [Gemmatirosa kalamazoonensis]AHG93580.1 protein synthesis factor GTP-binding protein [Gemmatirosa kalamazoonensis]